METDKELCADGDYCRQVAERVIFGVKQLAV